MSEQSEHEQTRNRTKAEETYWYSFSIFSLCSQLNNAFYVDIRYIFTVCSWLPVCAQVLWFRCTHNNINERCKTHQNIILFCYFCCYFWEWLVKTTRYKTQMQTKYPIVASKVCWESLNANKRKINGRRLPRVCQL